MKLWLFIALLTPALFGAPPATDSFPATSNPAALLRGRELFTAKCGKCHDADGRKKLSDGSTLLTRLGASKDWQALLGTRLKSLPPPDRQAVTAYVEELLKQPPK